MQTENMTEVLDDANAVVIDLTEWTFRYPTNATVLQWDDIHMDERSRKDFGNLEDLANSIRKNGLIHPPTVTVSIGDKPYKLIGGERRMRAMRMLEVPGFPVNVREAVEHHEVLEMELMENFHRKEMLWQEQCILIAKTHREKERVSALDAKSWGVRETGRLLGVSIAHISHATQLAPKLIAGDEELLAAPSMFAAYEILLKRQEDLAMRLATQNLNASAGRATVEVGGGIRATKDDTDAIFGDEATPMNLDEFLQAAHAPTAKLDLNFQELFQHGDCIELMPKMADECVHHIVTDPPYGIDLEMMPDIKNIGTVVDTHHVEQNVSMFEPFLEQSFRILKPGGYCAFWYDLDHHEKLQALGLKMGFKVQRWPLVWHKLHPCLNNAPRVNFTKNMEFVMVMRKGNACLVEPQISSVFSADGSADRKLYDNPFSKPLAAWKFVLQAIAYKSQIIFDPYAGQMSCARACVNLGMVPMGIEIDENHYNRGVVQLTNLVKEINGN